RCGRLERPPMGNAFTSTTARSYVVPAILLLASWVCQPAVVSAQTNTGEIQGVVTDPSGAVLPGATVTAVQRGTGVTVGRRPDDRGLYFIPGLPVGEYTLLARLEGFKVLTRSGIVLQVGQRLDVPMVLPIGSQSESVTVAAAAPILQTASAEISDVINNARV